MSDNKTVVLFLMQNEINNDVNLMINIATKATFADING